MEGACVVPVVEVPAKQLETAHGRQRGFQSFARFQGAQPTKVAGDQGREQIEPYIGRRRPVGHDGLRIFLKVIRWQRMVFRRHKCLEEPPGPARNQPERPGIGRRNRPGAGEPRRQADPARHSRSRHP